MSDKVTILGTRGSVPVSGPEFVKYGGATTCVVVSLAGQSVVLDAGTGILKLPRAVEAGTGALPLIITHSHVDHMLGLPMCPQAFDKDFRFDVYMKTRGGMGAKAQLESFLTLPIWPVGPDQLPADFSFEDLPESFELGGIRIKTMEGNHPGGVSMIRLDGNGKSVVFATDSVINEVLFPAFKEFAGSPDLLLIDGQYSQEEYDGHPNFGHNSWNEAAGIGLKIGAKQTLIIHHNTTKTDEELDALIPELQSVNPNCSPAFEGQEVIL